MTLSQFTKNFDDKHVDQFIAKQKLAGAAITAVKGEVAAMQSQQAAYGREIERLIKSGLDPESASVKRLQGEYTALGNKIEESEKKRKAAADGMKMIETATKAAAAAVAALSAAFGAAIQKTAEAGNAAAKTARIVGTSAEAWQELEYAADMSGVSAETLKKSMQKLNNAMGELKGGSGALSKYLEANDRALLENLRSAGNTEKAFMLLMDAVEKAPDEFTRAQLAQQAFGKSGQDLILFAEAGAQGIADLRDEAREYGIISNDAAAASEEFLDAQTRVKTALEGVRNEIAGEVLPKITDMINGFAGFISGIDDWEGKLRFLAAALISTASALTVFVAVSKGSDIVKKMTDAIKGLQLAFTGPAAGAAIAAAALAAAFSAIVSYQEKQKDLGKDIAGHLSQQKDKANDLVDAYEKLNPQKAVDEETTRKLIGIYPELSGKIDANKTSVADLRAEIVRLNEVKPMAEAAVFINKAKKAQEDYNKAVIDYNKILRTSGSGNELLGEFDRKKRMAEADIKRFVGQANDILAGIGKEVNPSNNFAVIDSVRSQITRLAQEAEEAAEKANRALSQRLNEITKTPGQALNEQINQIKSFLNQRADLERASGEKRISAYQAELKRILAAEYITEEERKAAKKAAEEAIAEYRDKMAEDKEKKDKAALEKELTDFKAMLQTRIEALEEAGALTAEQLEKDAEIAANLEAVSKENRKAAEKSLNDALKSIYKERLDAITEALGNIDQTEAQAEQERRDQFTRFLDARMEAESLDGEARLEFLREQQALILAQFEEGSAEYESAQNASNERIKAEEEALAAARLAIKEKELSASSDFFGAMSDLAETGAEESRGLAVASRALAAAQAAINSYLAFTMVLRDMTIPSTFARVAMAATVLASGLAQQIKIIRTPIPSAETGGRFYVPEVSPRTDGAFMRVNPGEAVDVTPRGMDRGEARTQVFNLMFNSDVLATAINRLARDGELHTLQLAGNL
jgi:hypothetical protein